MSADVVWTALVIGFLVGNLTGFFIGRARAEWGRLFDDWGRDWRRRHGYRD